MHRPRWVHVRAGNAEIFFTTRGDGPVCLVPSSIGTKPYERQVPVALSDRLKLVFVDLRGSGSSTGEPADLTFDLLAEDLEAVRRAVGAKRVAVLGHSMLGALALEYARRRPESVSHVILAGSPTDGDMAALQAKGTAHFQEHASPERKQRLQENLSRLPPGVPPAQAVVAQTPLRFFDATFDAAPLYAEAQPNPSILMHVLGTMLRGWDASRDAGALRMPVLVAHGRHDYVVPWIVWQGVVETFPRASLRLFEKSGHQPFFEEPEAFTAAVTTWMAGTAS